MKIFSLTLATFIFSFASFASSTQACSILPISASVGAIESITRLAQDSEERFAYVVGVELKSGSITGGTYEVTLQDPETNATTKSQYRVRWVETPVPGRPSCPRPVAEKI